MFYLPEKSTHVEFLVLVKSDLIVRKCPHLRDKEANTAETSSQRPHMRSILSSRTLLTRPGKDFVVLCCPLSTIPFWMASLHTNSQFDLPIAVFLQFGAGYISLCLWFKIFWQFFCLPSSGGYLNQKPS